MYIYTCTYIYVYLCMCVCVGQYMHIHTYIHVHKNFSSNDVDKANAFKSFFTVYIRLKIIYWLIFQVVLMPI